MTQAELAESAGINAGQISRYESGNSAPRALALAKIAKALDVSLKWLQTGEGRPEGSEHDATIKALPQTADKYPSEEADRFMVRMPPGMRDRIAEEADANGRSMNAEIVLRLQESYGRSDVREELREIRELLYLVVSAIPEIKRLAQK
jgi:transcriptional regulator with XRE-family HTH domain